MCVPTTSPCGSTPTFHTNSAGTIYCGTNGGTTLDCTEGQQCCVGGGSADAGYAPQTCVSFGSTCSNGKGASPGLPIECNSAGDCSANGVSGTACCLRDANPTEPACTYPRYAGGSGIFCESSCAAGEVQVCASQADCPSGTTCTAGKWKIFDLGFCIQEVACPGSSSSSGSGSGSSSGSSSGGTSCIEPAWASATNPFTGMATYFGAGLTSANYCTSNSDCCKGGVCAVGVLNPVSQGYCIAECAKNSDCNSGCCATQTVVGLKVAGACELDPPSGGVCP